MTESREPQYDAVVIRRGEWPASTRFYRLQELGMSATVLEAADGPGGTWYLESLSRRAVRLGELHLRILMSPRNCWPSGTGASTSPVKPRP